MRINKRYIVAILIILAVIIIDQLINIEIKTNFMLHEDYRVAGDWFHLLFTENRGMAFGMQFVGTMFLALFRVVAIGFFCTILNKIIRQKAPYGLIGCVAMIIAGAAGNIIDNLFYGLIFTESTPYSLAQLVPFGEGYGAFLSGKVVDMFYFPLIDTILPDWVPVWGGQPFVFFRPIFNLADSAICVGVFLLLIFYRHTLTVSLSKDEEKH